MSTAQQKPFEVLELALTVPKVRAPLPDSAHAVLIEHQFTADHGQAFRLRLCNEHAVEGILMGAGQQSGSDGTSLSPRAIITSSQAETFLMSLERFVLAF